MNALTGFGFLGFLAMTACSPLLPQIPQEEQKVQSAVGKEAVQRAVDEARSAWQLLSSVGHKKDWPAARKVYNRALTSLMTTIRKVVKKRGHSEELLREAPFVLDASFYADDGTLRYRDFRIADEIDTSFRLKESVRTDGCGVPIVGIIPAPGGEDKKSALLHNDSVHTVTILLDFDHAVNGKPLLKAVPRLSVEHVEMGRDKIRQPLAGNFSAPIALFWKMSDAQGKELLGAFRPKRAISTMGLYTPEPYDPHKIPVLFTHGLMSGPATFADLTNRLMVDPVIRQNFQFWFFGYPSGLAWTLPAKKQREALHELVRKYNPTGTGKEMNNIVMVGHSMGGLITRLNTSTKPWTLMKGMFELPDQAIESITLNNWRQILSPIHEDGAAFKRIEENFIFAPPSNVTRIVYMATPHRGSSFADNWVGRIGIQLIDLPSDLLEEVSRIATLSDGMILLNPLQLKDDLTSISQLSPKSRLIKNIRDLRPLPNVTVHSVIGDRGKNDTPNSSDGIVEYNSSHLDQSVSEKIVPSSHSVQNDPKSAVELRRILREHLAKVKGPQVAEQIDATAPTPIWKTASTRPVILHR